MRMFLSPLCEEAAQYELATQHQSCYFRDTSRNFLADGVVEPSRFGGGGVHLMLDHLQVYLYLLV